VDLVTNAVLGGIRMLRSARLISQSKDELLDMFEKADMSDYIEGAIDALKAVDIHTEIFKGDIMTGWEIIASLPLEQQKTLKGIQEGLEGYGFTFNEVFDMCALYRWNGEAWEVVE